MIKPIAFDVETTGKHIYLGDRVFAYATCNERGRSDVFRFDRTATRRVRAERVLARLWNNADVAKVGHNILFDIGATRETGYPVKETPIHDTLLMSRILRNNAWAHGLAHLAWELCGYSRELDYKVKRLCPNGDGYERISERLMDAYQRSDVERTMLLFKTFWPDVQADPGFLDEYNTELALTWVTQRIIKHGIELRPQAAIELVNKLTIDTKTILRDIAVMVGRPINPRGEEMRKLLFNELKLPIVKRSEKTGKPSMDKEVFTTWEQDPAVSHPVLDKVLQYRSYAYSLPIIESYLNFADRNNIIHSSIGISVADTGRQSSRDPNLQNVEKPGVIANRFPVPARHLFGPRYDHVWFMLDYGGQEALLLVHYSDDPEMLKIINSGGDMHGEAAAIAYGDHYTLCNDPVRKYGLRHQAKGSMSFGIPYGGGDRTACLGLRLHPDVGLPRLQLYRKRFEKYCKLNGTLIGEVRRKGYIKTAFGRKLYVPRDKPYVATNYLIQGTGAGMLKRAQVRVDAYLRDVTQGQAAIALPVHDEIVIEWPRNLLPQAPAMLRDIADLMTDFGRLFKVPFKVECRVATAHWGRATEVDIYAKAA